MSSNKIEMENDYVGKYGTIPVYNEGILLKKKQAGNIHYEYELLY